MVARHEFQCRFRRYTLTERYTFVYSPQLLLILWIIHAFLSIETGTSFTWSRVTRDNKTFDFIIGLRSYLVALVWLAGQAILIWIILSRQVWYLLFWNRCGCFFLMLTPALGIYDVEELTNIHKTNTKDTKTQSNNLLSYKELSRAGFEATILEPLNHPCTQIEVLWRNECNVTPTQREDARNRLCDHVWRATAPRLMLGGCINPKQQHSVT